MIFRKIHERLALRHAQWRWRYGLAALFVLGMIGAKLLMGAAIGGTAPFLLLLLPVILSAWVGGFGPGVFATVTAAILGDFLFLSPVHSFLSHPPDAVRMSVFLAEGVFVSLLCEWRLRSENRLLEQKKWFEVTIGSVGDAVIATDPEGRVTLLNATAEVLTGWKEVEALRRPLDDVFRVINEETRESVESPMTRVLAQGSVVGLGNHTLLVSRDGREIPIEDSGAPIRDASGTILGVVLVFRDATQTRESERALRESERRFRVLTDTAPVMVWTSGTDAACDWFNKPWLEFTGRTMERELGNGWTEGIHADDLERCVQTRARCFEARQRFRIEYRLRRHDGQYRWVLESATPRCGPGEEFLGYVGSCMDITDRQRTTRQLAAQYAVSAALAESGTLAQAAPSILRVLCEHLEWEVGILWTLDRKADSLRCQEIWHAPTISCPEFEAKSRQFVFGRGVGLPGRVLASGKPTWIHDVLEDSNFPRAPFAAQDGIRTGASFPVIVDGSVRGVVEFFSRHVRQPEQDVLDLMGAIGTQIGQYLSRKASEQAVRESDARKVAVLESSLDGVITIDARGRVLEMNAPAERMFGRTLGELEGKEMAAFLMPEELRDGYRQGLARYLATGRGAILGKRLEMPGQRADGSRFPVELTVVRIPVDGPPTFTGFVRDLTEKKRSETAVRFLADASQALASSLDYRNTLEKVARLAVPAIADWSAVHMLEPEGVVHELAVSHVDPRKLDLVAELNRRYPTDPEGPLGYRAVVRTGEPEMLEMTEEVLRQIAKDEDHLHHLRRLGLRSLLCVPLRARGRTLGAISLATSESGRRFDAQDLALAEELARRAALAVDNARLYREAQNELSERKNAELALRQKTAELERSNAELERFAYLASHDLQEPLRMVMSYTQLLSNRYRGRLDGDADEFISFAVEGVRRMESLIQDLLAYSRVDSATAKGEPTELGAVLEEVLANLRTAIEESGAVITSDPLPTVLAPRANMLQLLQNLLGNAIKFKGASSPRIHVGASRRGDDWRFSVRDNGIGIEAKYHEQIFLIFKRLHHHSQYPGTGVGLAICKKTVEQLRGSIWVESAPDQGSTFFFTLPARDEVGQEAPRKEPIVRT